MSPPGLLRLANWGSFLSGVVGSPGCQPLSYSRPHPRQKPAALSPRRAHQKSLRTSQTFPRDARQFHETQPPERTLSPRPLETGLPAVLASGGRFPSRVPWTPCLHRCFPGRSRRPTLATPSGLVLSPISHDSAAGPATSSPSLLPCSSWPPRPPGRTSQQLVCTFSLSLQPPCSLTRPLTRPVAAPASGGAWTCCLPAHWLRPGRGRTDLQSSVEPRTKCTQLGGKIVHAVVADREQSY